jgi:putative glycosyltransferase (TIGR04372 family)
MIKGDTSALGRAQVCSTYSLALYLTYALNYGYEGALNASFLDGPYIDISIINDNSVSLPASRVEHIKRILNRSITEYLAKGCPSRKTYEELEEIDDPRLECAKFEMLVAVGANVEVIKDRLHRILSCGIAINPRLVEAFHFNYRRARLSLSSIESNPIPSVCILSRGTIEGRILFSGFINVSYGHLAYLMEALNAIDSMGLNIEVQVASAPKEYRAQPHFDQETLRRGFSNLIEMDGQAGVGNDVRDNELPIDMAAFYTILSKYDIPCIANRVSLERCRDKGLYYPQSVGLRKSVEIFMCESEDKLSIDVANFCRSCEHIVVLHHRDGGYSYSSVIRDSDLFSYTRCVRWLLQQGVGVAILNFNGQTKLGSDLYLDHRILALGPQHSQIDQLKLMSCATYMIGTASGISNWWMLFKLPVIYVNTAALPATFVFTNSVHSAKRLLKRLDSTPDEVMLASVLCGSWDSRLNEKLEIANLSDVDILDEVREFHEIVESNPEVPYKTSHQLWAKLLPGIRPKIPDYYMTASCYNNLLWALGGEDSF